MDHQRGEYAQTAGDRHPASIARNLAFRRRDMRGRPPRGNQRRACSTQRLGFAAAWLAHAAIAFPNQRLASVALAPAWFFSSAKTEEAIVQRNLSTDAVRGKRLVPIYPLHSGGEVCGILS